MAWNVFTSSLPDKLKPVRAILRASTDPTCAADTCRRHRSIAALPDPTPLDPKHSPTRVAGVAEPGRLDAVHLVDRPGAAPGEGHGLQLQSLWSHGAQLQSLWIIPTAAVS